MTALRIRTAGNNPQTRVTCDWHDRTWHYCGQAVFDWDAREARKRGKALGWKRIDGKDYCPEHDAV